MKTALQIIRHAYTIKGIRHALQSLGLNGDQSCNSYVYAQSAEFMLAAAIARSTIGA